MQWTYTRNVDGIKFVPVTFPLNKPDSLLIEGENIKGLIEYLQDNNIKKAFIQQRSNFDFLLNCGGLEHIGIELRVSFSEYENLPIKGKRKYKEYDLKVLNSLSELKSLDLIEIDYNSNIKTNVDIDLSKLTKLEAFYGKYDFVSNLYKASSIKSLVLIKYSEVDFSEFSELKRLDTMKFTFSKLKTLNGCENLTNLQCLYLYHNRLLYDITALGKVKKTLKALRIENCPKIEDFSVLAELENLELLELSGKNRLPNLNFLKKMKNLKTFVFNMYVDDGDLEQCKNLSYVYSEIDRKHYNVKDKDLPKGKYYRGNEDIELWRRLE